MQITLVEFAADPRSALKMAGNMKEEPSSGCGV
jgi:hypothetical protein